MNPTDEKYKVGFFGSVIVDGAALPEKHRGHVVTVLEHVPKC